MVTDSESRWRWSVSRFFLTWPQVDQEDDMAASLALARAMSWFAGHGMGVKWMVVCREKHQDGELHYHMGVQTNKIVRSSDPKLFDGLFKKHGNYKKMKGTTKQCLIYLCKDGDYAVHGIDVKAALRKERAQGADACVELIKGGASLSEIWKKMPSYILRNKRKVQECIALDKSLKRQKITHEWTGLQLEHLVSEEHSEAERSIAKWLDENLFQKRDFKKKQLYIWGDTNLGKTTLANTLQMFCRMYSIPREEDFYDFYDDDRYDLAILDEFKASKTIQWMNEWLQGAPMVLRAKGFQIEKADNLPTIILSNFSLEEIYTHVNDAKLDTLRGRLTEVHVESFIKLDLMGLQKEKVLEETPVLPMEVVDDENVDSINIISDADTVIDYDIPRGEWGTIGESHEAWPSWNQEKRDGQTGEVVNAKVVDHFQSEESAPVYEEEF